MDRGYFALWRRYKDHPFWNEKRVFSKAEAWIDMLWEAQHSFNDKQVTIGNTCLICHYGETLKSLETWSKRWNWNKSRVRRFLKLLENMDQVRVKSETKTTRITILNYSKYDPRRNESETKVKRKRNASETQATPDNNVKNEKNEKNVKNIRPLFMDQKDWEDLIAHKKRNKGAITERTIRSTIKQLQLSFDAGLDMEKCVDEYLSTSWSAYKHDWIAKRLNGGHKTTQFKPPRAAYMDQLVSETKELIRGENGDFGENSDNGTRELALPLPGGRT